MRSYCVIAVLPINIPAAASWYLVNRRRNLSGCNGSNTRPPRVRRRQGPPSVTSAAFDRDDGNRGRAQTHMIMYQRCHMIMWVCQGAIRPQTAHVSADAPTERVGAAARRPSGRRSRDPGCVHCVASPTPRAAHRVPSPRSSGPPQVAGPRRKTRTAVMPNSSPTPARSRVPSTCCLSRRALSPRRTDWGRRCFCDLRSSSDPTAAEMAMSHFRVRPPVNAWP